MIWTSAKILRKEEELIKRLRQSLARLVSMWPSGMLTSSGRLDSYDLLDINVLFFKNIVISAEQLLLVSQLAKDVS